LARLPAPAHEEENMRMDRRTIGLLVIALCCGVTSLVCASPQEELGVCLNAKGTVYYYEDQALEAWVTIGSRNGLRPEARVVFERDCEVVAEGSVVTVREADAAVRVDEDVPAGSILLGDDVRVTENGPRSAVVAQMAHERREKRAGMLLIYALLATCINLAK
jgi:hypothetical protein